MVVLWAYVLMKMTNCFAVTIEFGFVQEIALNEEILCIYELIIHQGL